MNNQNDNGSLQQVALPADGGSKGGSDSRSETLSPREWATLKAALHFIEEAEVWHRQHLYACTCQCIMDARRNLREIVAAHRSGRPRGESAKLTDAGAEPVAREREGA